jgi:DNA processing protein
MNATQDVERARRVTLSYASEPGDEITAVMISRLGTRQTIEAVTGAPPEIRGIDHNAILDWQERTDKRLQTRTADGVMEACLRHGIHIVIPGDSGWPTQLDDLPNPPVALYVKGDLSPLSRNLDSIVTIVGSRAATGYGEFVTQETVEGLSRDGFTIVSGVAYGIEGHAMRSALVSGDAPVAFLAGGLDRPYPAGHQELVDRVAEHGAVASEVPPGMTPTRWRFMQRNRLLAAASGATVVVEAGARSGSLHVAAHAARLERVVAAFPGPVTSANSAGTHLLIEDRVASLVTKAEDITRLIDQQGPNPTAPAPAIGVTPIDQARSRSLPDLGHDEPEQTPSRAAVGL